MNIHSGGPVPPPQHYGPPPPGPPGAPPGHPSHPHYPGEPVYPPPPPGVHIVHHPHPHHGGPHGHPSHPHHMGDDSMDGGLDHEDSDANVNDEGVMNMGGPMVGVMGHPGDGSMMEPPKRKRRRQALSCTECKRRKIKCDRINPCGPCVRRGEQDKCQWHVIEPLEKFVTRAEYDDLRRKFDILERTVAQITGRPPGALFGPPPPGMAPPPPWGIPPPHPQQHMGGPGDPDSAGSGPRSPNLMVDPNLQVDPDNRRHDPGIGAAGGTGPHSQQLTSTEGGSKKFEAQTHLRGGEEAERLRLPITIPQMRNNNINKVKEGMGIIRGEIGHSKSLGNNNNNNNKGKDLYPVSTRFIHPHRIPMIGVPVGTEMGIPMGMEMFMDPLPEEVEVEEREGMGIQRMMIPAPIRLLPILPHLHPDSYAQLGGVISSAIMSNLSASASASASASLLVKEEEEEEEEEEGESRVEKIFENVGEIKSPLRTTSNVYSILNNHEGASNLNGRVLKLQGTEGVKKKKRTKAQNRTEEELSITHHVDSSILPIPSIVMPASYWIQGLPPKTVCDAITDFYFQHVAWSHGIIFESSFRATLDTFWGPEQASSSEGVGAAFVSLYFMILYHGVSHMDPEDSQNVRFLQDVQEWKRLCQHFWHGAQFALAQSDLAVGEDVEIIQSLILLAYVHLSLDDKTWQAFTPTLAFTIRLAQNRGYANLGEEHQYQKPEPGIQLRELKRRLWWSLVILDWQNTGNTRAIRMINQDNFATSIPHNVNLENLVDDKVFSPTDNNDEYTEVSLLRSKCILAIRARGRKNGEHEEDMSKYHLLPKALVSLDEDIGQTLPRFLSQRLVFLMSVTFARITLLKAEYFKICHKTLNSSGEYVRTAGVVQSMTESASLILKLVRLVDKAGLPARRWWGVLIHAYRACIVLLLDEQCRRAVDSRTGKDKNLAPMPNDRVHGISMVIDLLQGVKNVVTPAHKASLILQHLLDEAQSLSFTDDTQINSGCGKKRSRMELEVCSLSDVSSIPTIKKQKLTTFTSSASSPTPTHLSTDGLLNMLYPTNRKESKNKYAWEQIYDLVLDTGIKKIKEDSE